MKTNALVGLFLSLGLAIPWAAARSEPAVCQKIPRYAGQQAAITQPIDVRWPRSLDQITAMVNDARRDEKSNGSVETTNESDIIRLNIQPQGDFSVVTIIIEQKMPQAIPPVSMELIYDDKGNIKSSHISGEFLTSLPEDMQRIVKAMVTGLADQIKPPTGTTFIRSGSILNTYSLASGLAAMVQMMGGSLQSVKGPEDGMGFSNILRGKTVYGSRDSFVVEITGKETLDLLKDTMPIKRLVISGSGYEIMDKLTHLPLSKDVVTAIRTSDGGAECTEEISTTSLR